MDDPTAPRWLLLIHRIPPKPAYFRVKVWRRLQGVGAIAVKNTVYVLPRTDQAIEDFQWVSQEIVKRNGESLVCEARFIDGLTDDEVKQLFLAARDADYGEVLNDAAQLVTRYAETAATDPKARASIEAEVARLNKRLAELSRIDFFGAPVGPQATQAVERLERKLRDPEPLEPATGERGTADYQGRVWVTRKGIFVDRIASAWLIRRFIDPTGRFRFVPGKNHVPEQNELRFDMFEGEFTHEGDLCTFEVLLRRFGLDDAALQAIAKIIHDIDLKDSKFGRPETPGFERLITGIAARHKDDDERLNRGSALLDDLYEAFHRHGT